MKGVKLRTDSIKKKLSKEDWTKFKTLCFIKGTCASKVIADFIKDYLKKPENEKALKTIKELKK